MLYLTRMNRESYEIDRNSHVLYEKSLLDRNQELFVMFSSFFSSKIDELMRHWKRIDFDIHPMQSSMICFAHNHTDDPIDVKSPPRHFYLINYLDQNEVPIRKRYSSESTRNAMNSATCIDSWSVAWILIGRQHFGSTRGGWILPI